MSASLIRIPSRGAPAAIGERAAQNATLSNPPQWLRTALGGGSTAAGVAVTPEKAMQCAAVYACVRVLAESVAQLPLMLFERKADGSKEPARRHPLWTLLHDQPNPWQTSFEFREQLQGHLALRGNAYAYINRVDGGRRIQELIPLHPDRVSVEQASDLTVTYRLDRSKDVFQASEILHLRGLSSNGVTGLSPIGQARESIGLALATAEHGANLFGNGARPSGVLTHPGQLGDEAAARLKASWTAAHGGANRLGTAVLEEGLTWTALTMTSEDAQFLETRKYQRAEIASIFRIPPHLIGDLEKATFSNIEHQGLEFVVHSLMPWLVRWEQRIASGLLSQLERQRYFVKFNVAGLLRGDLKSRYDAYHQAIADGWLTRNETRALEDLNPGPKELDEFLVPLNMAKADDASPTPKEAASGAAA